MYYGNEIKRERSDLLLLERKMCTDTVVKIHLNLI